MKIRLVIKPQIQLLTEVYSRSQEPPEESEEKAGEAVSWFVTRQLLGQQVCTIPSWNSLWGLTGAGEFWQPTYQDRLHCWKGMGMGGCSNTMGYWDHR